MFKIMKKMTFVACAALLASTVTFTGCNNDDPKPTGETVNTNITISLPDNATGGKMFMPGTTVQVNNGVSDFQGIKKFYLIPFVTKDSIEGIDTRLGVNIELDGIGDLSGFDAAAAKAKLYTGKTVPVGTSSFLCYGESAASGAKFNKGSLTATSLEGNAASSFTFELEKIQPNPGDITGSTAHTQLLAYLNSVANATDSAGKAWKKYVVGTDNEGFAEMWATFATKKNMNSFNVQRMMCDLYKSIAKNTTDTLAKHIREAITNTTYVTVNTSDTTVALVSALQGFPESVDLPNGSIAVAYNTTDEAFESTVTKNFDGLNVAPIDSYVYPSSLWYTTNTTISTSDTLERAEYIATATWNEILNGYQKTNSSVNTKTRSIALEKKIEYAVARLDVCLMAAETLTDNNPETSLNQITNTTGYQLTGVLVGGQKNVGYDFKPTSYSSSPIYTIYDKVIDPSTIKTQPSTYSAANSTLVLETAASDNVYIAIELLNNSGKDFYGADGIIPAGGKFYMVAQLGGSYATETGGRVFAQDYTTTARLTIGNLKKAYNTIPDLKTPELEVGLAVDLTWKSGHTYDVTIQ